MASTGRALQRLQDCSLQRRLELRDDLRRWPWRRREVLLGDVLRVLAGKRRLAGDEEIEHTCQRIEVGALVERAPLHLLWRYVLERSKEPVGSRDGKAEVQEPDASI